MNFDKYFPYKTVRPQQKRVIEEIEKNWNTKKYFILQLDVGTGKSGIAKTICNSTSKSFIITSTKQLQDQYKTDFSHEGNMVDIKGKNNYKCFRDPNTTCDLAICKNRGKNCKFMLDTCPYYRQRNAAIASQIALTSYAYALKAITGEDGCAWKKRDLVVFDEAHLLENELVTTVQFSIEPKALDDKYNLYDELNTEDYNEIMKVIKSSENFQFYIDKTSKCLESKLKAFEDALEDMDSTDPSYRETMKNKEALSTLNIKITAFINTYKSKLDWMIGVSAEGALQFTPLKVKNLFKYFCSNWADKFIFMSATILDINGFIDQLGVNPDDCCVIKEESEFDPKKSPIYFMPCGSMSYSQIDQTLPIATKYVKQILDNHSFEKGIIHTGNYKIARYISDKIPSKRFLLNKDGKTSNQELINKHMKSHSDTVLLSPSMTTGVDLRDELSRWQIVMKLPYKSLADERIKTLSKIDPKWYACDVLRSLVQACGRSTRSAEDSSKTYVLDSGFGGLVKQYKSWLPQSFLKRIVGLEV